ncbi:MAG: hypothetical protein AAF549_06085 [Pseudomonadota bacterium]
MSNISAFNASSLFKHSLRALPFLAFMNAAHAETVHFPGLGTSINQQPQNEETIEYVDLHTAFVIDDSGSVDMLEKQAMMRGIAEVLLRGIDSERLDLDSLNESQRLFLEAVNDQRDVAILNRYSSYAISIVFFGTGSCSTGTFIMNSPEDAFAVISDILWDPVTETIPSTCDRGGSGTQMMPALREVNRIFANESEQGFIAISRSVVVLGDESPSDAHEVSAYSQTLSSEYGATIYGVPITDTDDMQADNDSLTSFYRDHVATPNGLHYTDAYGGQYEVRAGASMPANNFLEVAPAVALALDLGAN